MRAFWNWACRNKPAVLITGTPQLMLGTLFLVIIKHTDFIQIVGTAIFLCLAILFTCLYLQNVLQWVCNFHNEKTMIIKEKQRGWIYRKGCKRFHWTLGDSALCQRVWAGGGHLAEGILQRARLWVWAPPLGRIFSATITAADPDFKAALLDAVRKGVLETHFLPWHFYSRPTGFSDTLAPVPTSISKWECCSQISCELQTTEPHVLLMSYQGGGVPCRITPCAYLNY